MAERLQAPALENHCMLTLCFSEEFALLVQLLYSLGSVKPTSLPIDTCLYSPLYTRSQRMALVLLRQLILIERLAAVQQSISIK